MARRFPTLLLSPALLAYGILAAAQHSQPAPGRAENAVPLISLGQAIVPLNGPWKFQIGDSPIDPVTHNRMWADPGFDDSRWETVDLSPVPGQSDPFDGDPRWVKGWQARGHADYTGWAWYRLQIRVAAPALERLAIDGPRVADDAWQLFANGQLLGSFGEFDRRGNVSKIYWARPRMLLLPNDVGTTSVSGTNVMTVTLAFRTWLASYDHMGPGGIGGLHYAPLLVAGGAIRAQSHLDWEQRLISQNYAVEGAIFLLLAIVAASLTLFDPSDKVYLWVAGVLLFTGLGNEIDTLTNVSTWFDTRFTVIVHYQLVTPLLLGGWLMVWWHWFRLQRPAWAPRVIGGLTLAYTVLGLLVARFMLNYAQISPRIWGELNRLDFAFRLVFELFFFLVMLAGIRKEGKDGWLALPAVAAMALGLFPDEIVRALGILGGSYAWHPFGMMIFFSDLANIVLVAILGLLMLRRLLLSMKRQRQTALDVKQAQEVQQVILPQARTTLKGLQIECEYRPAREVGGDFFQIIPNEMDGSVLIVAGDVTGKGLKAGMLVALLVGAIRSTVEMTSEPLPILQALNRRLLGRGDAHATCLTLWIEADGSATLANAGHMVPYLNGEPMAMEGSLPLGMTEGAEFTVLHFRLHEHDRLVLMSDGIVEATDANGKLFGFERVCELLRTVKSPAEIATTAQRFGQKDDISVISVTRTPVQDPALALLAQAD